MTMASESIENIVFDLGGVLIDWNPKYLYNKIFNGDEKMVNWFLTEVCTSDWNVEQDAGRPFDLAARILIEEFPEQEENIRAYYGRWDEMLGGEIKGTVELLEDLKRRQTHGLYALTNWSSETFPIAVERFDFLQHFEGIVVSGSEQTRKPFPKIYEILLDRHRLRAPASLFIDDSLENVSAALKIGMRAIHFHNPDQLRSDLLDLGVID